MRTADYYAQQIHGFFVGFGLGAIEEYRAAEAPAVEKPVIDYDADAFDADCIGCSCHLMAPCGHCTDNHDEIGCEN
jgi:hypothetical protein